MALNPDGAFSIGIKIGRRFVAISCQQTCNTCAADQIMGQYRVQRRQCQCMIFHHFYRNTPLTKQNNRTKYGISGHTYNEFARIWTTRHSLH